MLRAVLFAALVLIGGCNTVEGVGRDIEAAGDALSDAAGEARRSLP